MKALLICPATRDSVAALSESAPLCNFPMFGASLIEHWLTHLASLGAKEVFVLASERPEQVRAIVEEGARWGLRVEIFSEFQELAPADALSKYRITENEAWLPAPNDAIMMDHLPGAPDRSLFTSYAETFKALNDWMPRAALAPDCIGVRELKPGVWVGLHAHISPDAELRAPCWIGENVYIGPGAAVGPRAIVEKNSFVEKGAEIAQSIVGAETFVGELTRVRRSVALGNMLVDWKLGSTLRVPDDFLLCSLSQRRKQFMSSGFLSRLASVLAGIFSPALDSPVMVRGSSRNALK